MSHVVDAIYENGMLKPDRPLPLTEREKVRVTVERVVSGGHSVLDIPTVSLGNMLVPAAADDDLLGEMLAGSA